MNESGWNRTNCQGRTLPSLLYLVSSFVHLRCYKYSPNIFKSQYFLTTVIIHFSPFFGILFLPSLVIIDGVSVSLGTYSVA